MAEGLTDQLMMEVEAAISHDLGGPAKIILVAIPTEDLLKLKKGDAIMVQTRLICNIDPDLARLVLAVEARVVGGMESTVGGSGKIPRATEN